MTRHFFLPFNLLLLQIWWARRWTPNFVFADMMMDENRRASYATPPRKASNPAMAAFEANRRPSLKEMPSYRDEASRALHRREDVKSIKDRLSASKEILNADPSTKPWLRRTSTPRKDSTLERVSEDSNGRGSFGTFTATPAVAGSEVRSRNLSRSTTSSSEGSYNSESNYFEFWVKWSGSFMTPKTNKYEKNTRAKYRRTTRVNSRKKYA